MPTSPLPISDALNKMFAAINSGFWLPFFLAVSGLGSLTMAILQAIKELTPIRLWFQSYVFNQWLKDHARIANDNKNGTPSWCNARDQIILLATDCDVDAFFSLEIEKLCGEWNAAIQIVLDSPQQYPDFFSCVAARALHPDFEVVYDRAFPTVLPPILEAKLSEADQQHRHDSRQHFLDARTRVSHQIQRGVDAFQITTAFRWKWLFQVASFVLSFALAAAAMELATKDLHPAQTIIWAAVAGFLAPVARDLLAAVQKLRQP